VQGKAAAYEIFSWDSVTISIQNICPPIDNRINSDLQPLILEASRLKDEAPHSDEEPVPEEPRQSYGAALDEGEQDQVLQVRRKLETHLGHLHGIEDVYIDASWDGLLREFDDLGDFFGTGKVRLCYLDKGDSYDSILVPGSQSMVVSVSPKSPRDKILNVLNRL
jgi:hypothetical protein